MTTELEEQFFKTFEIKKREHAFLFSEPDGSKYYYPKITDRKLLEMICILNFKFPTLHNACGSDRKTLLEYVLTRCITDKNYVEHQIQQLFKGEE